MANAVNIVDVVLVVALVATAAFFLAWTMLGRGPKRAPACHNVSASPLDADDVGGARSGASAGAPSANVVIGGALARGLERAAAKRRL